MSAKIDPLLFKINKEGDMVWRAHYHGKDHGMTVSSFTSVSMDPPLVTISLMKDSRTQSLVIQSASFGITILSSAQVEISQRFAGQIPDTDDRFAGLETFNLDTGAPMLKSG